MELMMRRGILLFLSMLAPALADVSNVRVIGKTATQALLAYTAPDNAACSVAVSASSTYAPLVYDVDPAAFAGADQDSRPGSIAIGRSRIFVAGTRTVATDLTGNNRSRALQAATTYYFRITCPSDGSTATGQFTTQTIPNGVGYGDPIPIDPANNGNYLYPTFSTTDRTWSATDPHTGALVKNFTLPGDLQGGVAAGMGSSGTGVMCHPTPVKASDEDKYGYHCQIGMDNSGAEPGLFWIAPDGETRFLGVMRTNYTANWYVSACTGSLSAPFDAADPNTFYCVVQAVPAPYYGNRILVKAVYSGHSAAGQDADLTNQNKSPLSGMPHTTFTQIEPLDRDLMTLLKEFDPQYMAYGTACCGFRAGDWANGKYFYYMWGNSQDTPGWIAEYDPQQTPALQQAQFGSTAGCIDNAPLTGTKYTGQAGCVVASTGTFTGGQGSGLRWSTLHTLDLTPASTWVSVTLNALRMKTGAAYRVTLNTALAASGSPCSTARPAGNPITDWPDSSWAPGCSTITVASDPTLSGTLAGAPGSWPAQPGDLLTVDSATYNHHELLRLLDKGPDSNTWYVQREWLSNYPTSCNYSMWHYSSVAAGGTLDMLSPAVYPDCNITGMQIWWDPTKGALRTDSTTVYRDILPQGHPAYINHPQYGRWTYLNMTAVAGPEPTRLVTPPASLLMNLPTFNGIAWTALETHPSLSVSNPPDQDTYQQAVDNWPYYGDTTLATASTVSAVGGQLYRIRGTNIASRYKLVPYFANSGSRAMKEVSGPSVRLATDSTTQFQWCVALNAGECYAGSQTGDVYFNAPGVVNPYCTNNWSTLQTTTTIPNDICVSPSLGLTQAIEMQEIGNDPYGLQLRVISNAMGKYEQQSVFWNSRTIPDGSWLFTSVAADPGQLKLIRVPPRQKESGNRTVYVPISLSLPAAAGVDNVIVEFGYAENGDAGKYYCTARQESCVSQSAAINSSQPFYFATTEATSITGMPCRTGCTVTIPGLPGRVVYYRIDSRDNSGHIAGQQAGAQVVP